MSNKIGRAITYISQVGITMIVPIVLMGMVGVFIDRRTNSTVPFVICIILGIMAGIRNCYLLFKEEISKQDKEDHKKLKK